MIGAWRKAEQDLGIEINPEFTLKLKDRTRNFLIIENFGGPKGTIVTSLDDTGDFNELKELGFYCSALADSYLTYDRVLFVDTLNDWGFYGDSNRKPAWYTGQSWTL
jgi:hypothetical protein